MTIFGVDVSNHQAHFDFGAAAREGFDFAFLKCSQNDNFRDGRFRQHLDNARAAGLLVAAYHYQGTAPVASQVATVKAMVSPDVPVILDVEEGSGGTDITRALVDALRAEGYSVPLTYLPRWYWSGHIGSPDLSGLPPLWVSWYPDYGVRRKEQGLGMVPDSVWQGYGGLDVAVVQFTSAGAVADYPGGNIDLNAFAGTRAQLAALLGGSGATTEDDDMVLLYKAKGNDAFWNVTADGTDFCRRYVGGLEAAVLKARGVPDPTVIDEADLMAIPEIGASSTFRTREAIAELADRIGDDEAKIIAAVRSMPTGGLVDIPEFVAALVPALAPVMPVGITEETLRGALIDTLRGARLDVPDVGK